MDYLKQDLLNSSKKVWNSISLRPNFENLNIPNEVNLSIQKALIPKCPKSKNNQKNTNSNTEREKNSNEKKDEKVASLSERKNSKNFKKNPINKNILNEFLEVNSNNCIPDKKSRRTLSALLGNSNNSTPLIKNKSEEEIEEFNIVNFNDVKLINYEDDEEETLFLNEDCKLNTIQSRSEMEDLCQENEYLKIENKKLKQLIIKSRKEYEKEIQKLKNFYTNELKEKDDEIQIFNSLIEIENNSNKEKKQLNPNKYELIIKDLRTNFEKEINNLKFNFEKKFEKLSNENSNLHKEISKKNLQIKELKSKKDFEENNKKDRFLSFMSANNNEKYHSNCSDSQDKTTICDNIDDKSNNNISFNEEINEKIFNKKFKLF